MEFSAAREFVDATWRPLLFSTGAGIESISVGTRADGPVGPRTEFCVRIGVPRKRSRADLRAGGIEPVEAAVGRFLPDGLPYDPVDFDVVERGPARTAAPPRLSPGKSVAGAARRPPNPSSIEGSIGFFVTLDGHELHLVSCNHVLAGFDRGRVGDLVLHPAPRLLSPSVAGSPALARGHGVAAISAILPVRVDPDDGRAPPENLTDAAMAHVTRHASSHASLVEIPGTGVRLRTDLSRDPDAFGRPRLLNRRVVKHGAATGATEGKVTDLHLRMRVGWGAAQAVFVDQFYVSPLSPAAPFADLGDSGSAVVTDSGELLGLLFAVDPHGGAAANRIDVLLDALRRVVPRRRLEVVTDAARGNGGNGTMRAAAP
ncbi:MAG: hypothetical protein ACF8XB_19385 [Planctomycetota bacterium JB042]